MRIVILLGVCCGVLVVAGLALHLDVVKGVIGLAIGGGVGFGLNALVKRAGDRSATSSQANPEDTGR